MEIHSILKHKGEFFTVLETTDKSQIACMTIAASKDSGAYGQHAGDQLIYVIEGAGEIEVENERKNISEGEAFIIPAGARHKAYAAKDEGLFFVTIYAPPVY